MVTFGMCQLEDSDKLQAHYTYTHKLQVNAKHYGASMRERVAYVYVHSATMSEITYTEVANVYLGFLISSPRQIRPKSSIQSLLTTAMGEHWNIHKGLPFLVKMTYSMVAGQCQYNVHAHVGLNHSHLNQYIHTYVHMPWIWPIIHACIDMDSCFITSDLSLGTAYQVTVHEARNVHTCSIKGLVLTALSGWQLARTGSVTDTEICHKEANGTVPSLLTV